MTIAWYGHLKYMNSKPLWLTILAAWGVAFFEYCLQVPANRIGYDELKFSGYQLKVVQEVITLIVFCVFAFLVLGEKPTWNYIVSFGLILLAAFFAFGVKVKS